LGRPLVQIGELADKERLPIKFLEQILMQLKEAGYVESKRGKLGGYLLLMPPSRIKIGEVIRLIDGPLAPVSCVSVTAYERCNCPDEGHCGLRMLMGKVRDAIVNVLDTFSLADTVAMTLKKVRRSKASIPFIEGLLGKPRARQTVSTKDGVRKSSVPRTVGLSPAALRKNGRQTSKALAAKPQVVASSRKANRQKKPETSASQKISRPKAKANSLKPRSGGSKPD